MANQKPVDEIRIGRVKATIWRNGTDEQPRHNVTFARLYKDGDQWKSTHSFGRNDLLVLAKVADLAHTRLFQLPAEAELPEVQVAAAKAKGKLLGRPKGALGTSRLDGKEQDIRALLGIHLQCAPSRSCGFQAHLVLDNSLPSQASRSILAVSSLVTSSIIPAGRLRGGDTWSPNRRGKAADGPLYSSGVQRIGSVGMTVCHPSVFRQARERAWTSVSRIRATDVMIA